LGEDGIQHAKNKPFSDPECGVYLIRLGAIMNLIPPPPAKLLDIGCGTGWTSIFFAKRGYSVHGVDISEGMISAAEENKIVNNVRNIEFSVCDYEKMNFDLEFDIVIYFDSLHHSENETLALQSAFKALKNGGICVLLEPGKGHSKAEKSREVIEKFGTIERDMSPEIIWRSAKIVGFSHCYIFPKSSSMARNIYDKKFLRRSNKKGLYGYYISMSGLYNFIKSLINWKNEGLVVLKKE
jgi:ubiquinone/menaquinone biosynthesis C-methylase UbiE